MNNLMPKIYNNIGGKFMKKTYTIIIHKGEPDEGGYWAECLEVKGAYTQGKTIEEIKERMKEVIMLMLKPLPDEEKNNEEDIILEKISFEVSHA